MVTKALVALCAAAFTVSSTPVASGAPAGELAAARAATAAYHNIDTARAAGYELFTDAQGIACIDKSGRGAMGIHYANLAEVQDPSIDAVRPELVVYAPGTHGQMHLVALEYVVFKDAWDATHSTRPSLFGQRFDLTRSPNRYDLPPFYSLHAWVWKYNPDGMFARWNPKVSCPAG